MDPITPTTITAAIIPYNSVLDSPDKRGELLIRVNVTVFDTLAPMTDTEPDGDETEYPETLLTVYEYVPLERENEYDVPVIGPEFIPLDKLTYHAIPDGNPDSVNDTEYLLTDFVVAINVIF